MFVLKTKDLNIMLTPKEVDQVKKALAIKTPYLELKNNIINSHSVLSILPVKDFEKHDAIQLSEFNKWRCYRCGKVQSHEQGSRCNCTLPYYGFLGAKATKFLN